MGVCRWISFGLCLEIASLSLLNGSLAQRLSVQLQLNYCFLVVVFLFLSGCFKLFLFVFDVIQFRLDML